MPAGPAGQDPPQARSLPSSCPEPVVYMRPCGPNAASMPPVRMQLPWLPSEGSLQASSPLYGSSPSFSAELPIHPLDLGKVSSAPNDVDFARIQLADAPLGSSAPDPRALAGRAHTADLQVSSPCLCCWIGRLVEI